MRGPVWSIALVASLAIGVGATGACAAKLPAGLIVLEQKMQALHVNSERGTIVELVTGGSLGGEALLGSAPLRRLRHRRDRKRTVVHLTTHPSQSIPFLTADFEVSGSPKLAVIRGSFLGVLRFQERVIGEELYMRSSLLGLIDTGKPWISTDAAERAQEEESAQGGSEGASAPTPSLDQPGYAKLIKLLAHAGSVVEIGSREVDGQQTIEFQARLDGEQLLAASPGSKLSKAGGRKLRRSKMTLDLFLSDDGLPVRTAEQIQIGRDTISVVEDILATEVPVSVQPPPASETISQAELKKQEKSVTVHLTKSQRREIRRFTACLKRHRPKGRRRPAKGELKKLLRECPSPK